MGEVAGVSHLAIPTVLKVSAALGLVPGVDLSRIGEHPTGLLLWHRLLLRVDCLLGNLTLHLRLRSCLRLLHLLRRHLWLLNHLLVRL